MLDRVRKQVVVSAVARRGMAIPQVPAKMLLSGAVIVSFAWLLSQDMVQPIVIYALQLYLSF
jgi:hypothetical protein